MSKFKLEFRGRCPRCGTVRNIVIAYVEQNSVSMDALENVIDKRGGVDAHCPKCDSVEEIAFFANNVQTEPWLDAIEYETRNGPNAGPLPQKPWSDNT